jgi:DNA-binding transcriptional MerR regulator
MSDPAKRVRQDLLKIGEFAEAAGTNLRTLRYYEELGLLHPQLRSDGGFRYYRPTDVNRVRLIHGLQELGLPLERIRGLVDTRELTREGPEQRTAWIGRVRAALAEHRRLISERIETLQGQRDQIDLASLKLDSCVVCEHQPEAANNFCEPCQQTGNDLPASLSALF